MDRTLRTEMTENDGKNCEVRRELGEKVKLIVDGNHNQSSE